MNEFNSHHHQIVGHEEKTYTPPGLRFIFSEKEKLVLVRLLGTPLSGESETPTIIGAYEPGEVRELALQLLAMVNSVELDEEVAREAKFEAPTESYPTALNERQEWIIDRLREVGKITSNEIRRHFDVSPSTVKRDLIPLLKLKRIRYVASTGKGYYELYVHRPK